MSNVQILGRIPNMKNEELKTAKSYIVNTYFEYCTKRCQFSFDDHPNTQVAGTNCKTKFIIIYW